MPLTEFQRELMQLLRDHRNPNSYVAGGVAIHRSVGSPRRSEDIDFFHDTEEAVAHSAKEDISVLEHNGYKIEFLIDQPSFLRVVAHKRTGSLKLEWVRDTAFRFFPVIEDPELGYRLHDVDLIVNKCIALANREEVRDVIDLIHLQETTLSVVSACWAACGKDPGFTPELLLDCMRRHSTIRPERLSAEDLVKPISASELKREWLSILDQTEDAISKFPAADLGCLYLTRAGQVVPTPELAQIQTYTRHFGTVGGSWPRIVAV